MRRGASYSQGVESLKGRLLVAAPDLFDFFRRSIVLVVEHTEQGAFGVILNRRADTEVVELVPDLGPLVEQGAPLWVGGPVGPDSIVVLGDFERPEESAGVVASSIGVVDPDGDAEFSRARVFVGHAGWGPGQLEGEVERGSWIICDFHPEDVFAEGDLWSEVVRRPGPDFAVLATMPEDPSLN